MDKGARILSDLIVYNKYAKYIKKLFRRENFDEIIDRNFKMNADKFRGNKDLMSELSNAYQFVRKRKILPSMRALQFSGKPIEINPARSYNCAFIAVDDWRVFSETMFLLLGGTGVGYSVQRHHVEKLPAIQHSTKTRRYLIGDSIEGWADAIKMLFRSYFFGKPKPKFDYSDIREKGRELVTSGGKAPGHQPLHDCIHNITKILNAKQTGQQLTTLEVHDIQCFIADAVLAGGIRRAALISLFDIDDEDMLTCKYGAWYERNPQRGRSNNSAMIMRHKITEDKFQDLWKKIQLSGSGEPGFYLTNDKEWGCNPCCEIGMKSAQFCNLVEVNISDVRSQKELNDRVRAATTLATTQASYTEFHYLREACQKNCEKDSLIGVSLTGIASGNYKDLNFEEAAKIVNDQNKVIAKLLKIKPASRTTCIKPAGTTSLVFGCSSGIHAYYGEFYLRRIREEKASPLYKYLEINHPEILEDDILNPKMGIIKIPIKAPKDSILRNEPPIRLLERIKKFSKEWIHPGHLKGENSHNVSATISIKDKEWEKVGNWMWDNREYYNGLSVIPFSGGSYQQMPFEEIDEKTYNKLYRGLNEIDFDKINEQSDNTNLSGEIACSGGGSCEIK